MIRRLCCKLGFHSPPRKCVCEFCHRRTGGAEHSPPGRCVCASCHERTTGTQHWWADHQDLFDNHFPGIVSDLPSEIPTIKYARTGAKRPDHPCQCLDCQQIVHIEIEVGATMQNRRTVHSVVHGTTYATTRTVTVYELECQRCGARRNSETRPASVFDEVHSSLSELLREK
jgi:hypothetical protein